MFAQKDRKKGGKASAKSRFKGKSKRQISKIMSELAKLKKWN